MDGWVDGWINGWINQPVTSSALINIFKCTSIQSLSLLGVLAIFHLS